MNSRFVDTVANEIAKEKAESLGRAGQLLEAAVRELRAFEADGERPTAVREEQRRELVWRVAHLVTNIVVQREACGLIDTDYVLDFYDVPPEIVALLGKRPRPTAT
jgi:hypothetical protein